MIHQNRFSMLMAAVEILYESPSGVIIIPPRPDGNPPYNMKWEVAIQWCDGTRMHSGSGNEMLAAFDECYNSIIAKLESITEAAAKTVASKTAVIAAMKEAAK